MWCNLKKTIYFDFDGTLYDSDNFMKQFLNLCQKYKISEEKVHILEKEIFTETKLFNLDELVIHLKKRYSLPEEFQEEVEKLYSEKNIYSDVCLALSKIKESKKYDIVILTYGNIKYQQKKISNCDILDYIKEVIITEKKKNTINNIDYENSIFIDNHPEQIKVLKTRTNNVIRIRRTTDKYSNINTEIEVKEYNDLITLVEKELL